MAGGRGVVFPPTRGLLTGPLGGGEQQQRGGGGGGDGRSASSNSFDVMAATPTPGNLFDEFEEAFQNCMAPLIKEDNFNAVNQEELRTNAEASGQRFLDLARQMEAFFLQKRYLLSIQKPELIILEDIIEMRNELVRKDELLKKHAEKLNEWQGLLSSMQSRLGTSSSMGPRPPGPPGSGMHPGMMAPQTGSHTSVPMPGLSPVGGAVMGPTGPPPMQHNMNSPGMGMTQTSMMQASIMSNVGASSSTL